MPTVIPGATSIIRLVFIQDSTSTTGAGKTGLVFNTSGLTCYYTRDTDATSTAVSLATMTLGTWGTGGFKEVDATNQPGVYQLGVPNAAFAAGASEVAITLRGATGMADVTLGIDLGVVAANVTQIAGQTASAAGAVTFPGTIASTTNITGGTITTTANLTNAPTVGDFTAAMKASITTAATAATPTVTAGTISTDAISAAAVSAAAVTKIQSGLSTYSGGAVASVTGNVGGNVAGSVGSVTGAVGSVTAPVSIDKTQQLSAARDVSAVADTSLTLNDALHCAIAAAAGKETQVATTYTIKTPSTGTTLRIFSLDSATTPASRT